MSFILALGPWSWLAAGAVLLGFELLAPGVFMLWLGLAAILVGLASFVIAWSWQAQVIAFVVFSLAAVPLWRRISLTQRGKEPEGFLNRRADAFVGRVFTLEKPIVDGNGTVRIDDSIWRVIGPDLSAGSRVKVVRAEGAMLTVEKE
jgi:membrane protein implicated in regulation of membrane protease activity